MKLLAKAAATNKFIAQALDDVHADEDERCQETRHRLREERENIEHLKDSRSKGFTSRAFGKLAERNKSLARMLRKMDREREAARPVRDARFIVGTIKSRLRGKKSQQLLAELEQCLDDAEEMVLKLCRENDKDSS